LGGESLKGGKRKILLSWICDQDSGEYNFLSNTLT
jgi:hypothetical protein